MLLVLNSIERAEICDKYSHIGEEASEQAILAERMNSSLFVSVIASLRPFEKNVMGFNKRRCFI